MHFAIHLIILIGEQNKKKQIKEKTQEVKDSTKGNKKKKTMYQRKKQYQLKPFNLISNL